LGKKKVVSETDFQSMVLPATTDVLGVAVRMLGFDRILMKCQDGHEHLCRIRARLNGAFGFVKATLFWFLRGIFSLIVEVALSGATPEGKQIGSGRRATLRFRFLEALGD